MTKKTHKYIGLSGFQLGLLVMVCGYATFTVNPLETVAAILVVPVLVKLLWIRGEPAILLFVILWQWLEVTMKVYYSNVTGVILGQDFGGSEIYTAYWLGLLALLVISLGIRKTIGSESTRKVTYQQALQKESGLSVKKLFKLYVVFIALSSLAQEVLPVAFNTILVAFDNIRYAIIYVLFYLVVARKSGKLYFSLVFIIELVLGGTGFFSDFKYVIFVSLVVFMSAGVKINASILMKSVPLVLIGLIMGAVWSEVKIEYRNYLYDEWAVKQGGASFTERAEKILELVGEMDSDDLVSGFDRLFLRIQYIDFLAHTIRHVPDRVDHTGGELWGSALLHILQPRILFPNKESLPSDTVLTMKYTGLFLGAEDASISIGYVGDSYIDYGVSGMFVILFILGLAWGAMYRYFINYSPHPIFGKGMAVAVFLSAANFGNVVTKVVGGGLMGFIVCILILRYVLPLIEKKLMKSGRNDANISGISRV